MSKPGIIIKYEPVDIARLNKLIEYKMEHEDEDEPEKTQIDRLLTYKSKVVNGKVKVSYNFTSKTQVHEWGRVYADGGVSLQMMKRDIRGYLAYDFGIDVDMVNAHPNILLKVAKDNNCQHTALRQYVTQRDEILAEVQKVYDVDRDAAKQAFLMMLYLGSVADWEYWLKSEGYQVDFDKAHEKKIYTFMKAYESELFDIADVVLAVAPDMRRVYEKENPGKPHRKVMAGVLAWYISNIEHKILMEMDAFMAKNNRKVITLVYDGFIVKKNYPYEQTLPDNLLRECEAHALAKTGYNITLAVKPFESKYNDLIPSTKLTREQMDALDYDEAIEVLKENMDLMYTDKKYLFERFSAKIRDPNSYITVRKPNEAPLFNNKKDLLEVWSTIWVYDAQTADRKLFVSMWAADPKIREYERMNFIPPPKVCPKNVFNLWRGFAVETMEGDAALGSAEPFLKHLHIIAGHDNRCYRYIVNFLAHMIQRPGEITGTALIFIGQEGCGKNYVNEFMARLLGDDYTSLIEADVKQQLFSQFSNARVNKLLVTIDEVKQANVKDFTEQFKNMITSETMRYEPKTVNPMVLSNYNRFIFCSNYEVPLTFSCNNRRYVVMTCSPEKCKDYDYFTYMRNVYRTDPNNLKAVFDYLKTVDLEGFDWINHMPVTDTAKNIMAADAHYMDKYLEKLAIFLINKQIKTYKMPMPEFMKKLTEFAKREDPHLDPKPKVVGDRISKINDQMNPTRREELNVFNRTNASTCGSRYYIINVEKLEKYLVSKHLLSEHAFMFADDSDEPASIKTEIMNSESMQHA